MKRFIRTSVAAAAATSLLISATPAMAQESSTAASLSKETTTSTATTSEHTSEEPTTEKDKEKGSGLLEGLTALSRDDNGLLNAKKVKEWLDLISTIFKTLTNVFNITNKF